jgi:signal peptidase I
MNLSKGIREFIEVVVIAVVAFAAFQFGLRNYFVEGSSMEPTLQNEERILVNKLVYLRVDMQRFSSLIPFWQVAEKDVRFLFRPPRQGEVVVLKYEPADADKALVKRVVAVPGQTVEIRHGVVYVDGEMLDEPYITEEMRSTDYMSPKKLGLDEYFVLGDNRGASYDSRHWGPLKESAIIGRAWVIYWPLSKADTVGNP